MSCYATSPNTRPTTYSKATFWGHRVSETHGGCCWIRDAGVCPSNTRFKSPERTRLETFGAVARTCAARERCTYEERGPNRRQSPQGERLDLGRPSTDSIPPEGSAPPATLFPRQHLVQVWVLFYGPRKANSGPVASSRLCEMRHRPETFAASKPLRMPTASEGCSNLGRPSRARQLLLAILYGQICGAAFHRSIRNHDCAC